VLRASNSVAHSSSPSSQPASPSPPPIPHHHFAPSERHFDDDDLVAMPPPPPTLMDDYYTSARGGDIGHVSFSGLSEPCSIGSIVEVVVSYVLLFSATNKRTIVGDRVIDRAAGSVIGERKNRV
jgi:hypothetical protein